MTSLDEETKIRCGNVGELEFRNCYLRSIVFQPDARGLYVIYFQPILDTERQCRYMGYIMLYKLHHTLYRVQTDLLQF